MKKISIDRNTIKYIAVIAMLIDHIAAFLIGPTHLIYYPMRIIGRIAAPIMCFFLAEGYKHTKSKIKYGIRLFAFALISQIPYSLVKEGKVFIYSFNFIMTLFLSFITLLSYEKIKEKFSKWVVIVTITFLTLLCDWSIITPILVLLFYKIDEFNKMKNYYILIVTFNVLIITILEIILNNSSWYLNFLQMGMLFALPILKMYNGKSGRKSLYNKWFFYIFYPLHLLIIYLIELVL